MKIRELLSDESKWTKGYVARKADGGSTVEYDTAATCFCLVGAARHCYGYKEGEELLLEKVIPVLGIERGSLPDWNDNPSRTFSEVKALLEKLDI